MALEWAEASVEVSAPAAAVFETAVDYESFPEWQHHARGAEVLDRYPDGLGRIVVLHVDARLREVSYRLRYSYEPPGRIRWELLEGDLVSGMEGEYVIEALGEGSRATYRMGVELAIPVPRIVARRLGEAGMQRSVDDLRRETERRAGGS